MQRLAGANMNGACCNDNSSAKERCWIRTTMNACCDNNGPLTNREHLSHVPENLLVDHISFLSHFCRSNIFVWRGCRWPQHGFLSVQTCPEHNGCQQCKHVLMKDRITKVAIIPCDGHCYCCGQDGKADLSGSGFALLKCSIEQHASRINHR